MQYLQPIFSSDILYEFGQYYDGIYAKNTTYACVTDFIRNDLYTQQEFAQRTVDDAADIGWKPSIHLPDIYIVYINTKSVNCEY